jgi:hypothetical protein
MPEAIHIEDLAQPVLTEIQRAALAFGERQRIDFSETAVLAAARQRTGLADFGAPDFHLRLRLLLDEWGSDPEMTASQRANLFGYLVRYASNRLLIQDQWRRNPAILEQEVRAPVIVAGLPRSGTTHLLNLLAADTRFRSLPLWESYEPVPLPGESATADGVDPRYRRCEQAWEGMQQVTPLLAAMHPMNP